MAENRRWHIISGSKTKIVRIIGLFFLCVCVCFCCHFFFFFFFLLWFGLVCLFFVLVFVVFSFFVHAVGINGYQVLVVYYL